MTRSQCPYLSLATDQQPARQGQYLCHAHVSPEKVGGVYQATICLTEAHRRCPSLQADLAYGARQTSRPKPSLQGHEPSYRAGLAEIVPLPQPPSLSSRIYRQISTAFRVFDRQAGQHADSTDDSSPRLQDATAQNAKSVQQRPTQKQSIPQQKPTSTPRRLTFTEILVMGLGFSVVCAILLLSFAIFAYRSPVTFALGQDSISNEKPIAAPTSSGAAPVPTLVSSQPSASQPPPLLTPTSLEPTATATPVASPTPLPPSPTPSITPTPTPLPSPTPTPTPIRPPAQSPPTRLAIPSLDLDITVKPVGHKSVKVNGQSQVVWDTLNNVGCFHQTSALPGHPGNTVINGHRDIGGSVFLHLDKVSIGDKIVLYADEIAYPYRVTEILVRPYTRATAEEQAENLQLIGNMSEERLTLITCTPVGVASHRLYIIAKPPPYQRGQGLDKPIIR